MPTIRGGRRSSCIACRQRESCPRWPTRAAGSRRTRGVRSTSGSDAVARRRAVAKQTFVIVGASLAGAKAAAELRERGFDGRLVLIGAEAELPYERPPLSKDYLLGKSEREKARVHPEKFYEEYAIDLLTGVTVNSVKPAESSLALDDGRELRYNKLLLTTGSEPRRLDVPGSDLGGIHYL